MKSITLVLIAIAILFGACKKQNCKKCYEKFSRDGVHAIPNGESVCSDNFQKFNSTYTIVLGTDTFYECI